MINITEILGQRIRYYRKQKNISQEQLAKLADLHPTYIGQIERGEKNASIETIYNIAQGLQIPIVQLLEKIEEYPQNAPTSLNMTHASSSSTNIPLQAYELFSSQSKEHQKRLYNILIYVLEMKQ